MLVGIINMGIRLKSIYSSESKCKMWGGQASYYKCSLFKWMRIYLVVSPCTCLDVFLFFSCIALVHCCGKLKLCCMVSYM